MRILVQKLENCALIDEYEFCSLDDALMFIRKQLEREGVELSDVKRETVKGADAYILSFEYEKRLDDSDVTFYYSWDVMALEDRNDYKFKEIVELLYENVKWRKGCYWGE